MKMNCYQYKNKKYLPFERSLYGKRVKPSLDCENLYHRLFRQKRKELKTAVLHGFQTFFLMARTKRFELPVVRIGI